MIEGMTVLSREDVLQKADLPTEILNSQVKSADNVTITPGVPLARYEESIIKKNLAYAGGNREKTAKLLGISERTLYRKIKEYKI